MPGKYFFLTMALFISMSSVAMAGSYPIVDTGQEACFNNSSQAQCPSKGRAFYGQDSQYRGNQPKYLDNGDGTVSDLVTGLMWVKARGNKTSWNNAMKAASECRVGGYSDWRAPTIKELYSLIDFNGWTQTSASTATPYINTRYFDFKYGDTSRGERHIDCQDWSSTLYKGLTMQRNKTAFGVNFADGRIKGYGIQGRGHQTMKYIRYVRGNPSYGKNTFVPGADGTVTDTATSLIWQQRDSGKTYNWQQALNYCEKLSLAGRSDWRLPSAKELQSIVDYSRSPTSTGSAAIDPVFSVTKTESYYATSTTHLDGPKPSHYVYVTFGRAMGYMGRPGSHTKTFMDVHGAGAQRSDVKSGNPNSYPQGHGPQGDDVRIYNYVRCVTGGNVALVTPSNKSIGSWKGGRGSSSGMMKQGTGQGMGRQQGHGMSQGQGMQQRRQGGGQNQGQRRQGPPPEAFTSCEGKNQGDSCSFEAPHGTLSGTCRNMQEGLVCVPANHRGGPPQ